MIHAAPAACILRHRRGDGYCSCVKRSPSRDVVIGPQRGRNQGVAWRAQAAGQHGRGPPPCCSSKNASASDSRTGSVAVAPQSPGRCCAGSRAGRGLARSTPSSPPIDTCAASLRRRGAAVPWCALRRRCRRAGADPGARAACWSSPTTRPARWMRSPAGCDRQGRRDVRIVANDVLSALDNLDGLLLPVRILGGRPAPAQPARGRCGAGRGECVIVFPAGEVSRLGPAGSATPAGDAASCASPAAATCRCCRCGSRPATPRCSTARPRCSSRRAPPAGARDVRAACAPHRAAVGTLRASRPTRRRAVLTRSAATCMRSAPATNARRRTAQAGRRRLPVRWIRRWSWLVSRACACWAKPATASRSASAGWPPMRCCCVRSAACAS